MTSTFKSLGQEKLFEAVIRRLRHLGYTNELLKQHYSFIDYFETDRPERVVPAAAFGQTPQSYDSACIGVLLSNGVSGPDLVYQSRALGAPLAFEIRDDLVLNWRVGKDHASSKELIRIAPNQIDQVFEEHQTDWSAQDVLRRKGITFNLGPRQLDFIDLGLIPALEHHITMKLDRVLREVVADALKLLGNDSSSADALKGVYRLVFRFLAGKVLHDRGIDQFRTFSLSTSRKEILDAVAKHYGDGPSVPADPALQDLIASSIWTELDFRNLSVEVLAYIYENTFVAPEARKSLGTHSTPPSVARYIVHHLPFETFPENERRTLEPFCGHGVFLVAALQRLRELLSPTMDGRERHNYFVRMLRGLEIEPFALEVTRLCLMLADFPNSNGWDLSEADVFSSQVFTDALSTTKIVISNPPFEDFTEAERERYQTLSSAHKPTELLNRLMNTLPADAVMGIVLPSRFLDGVAYSDAREKLARRYQAINVVSLPDGIFEKSEMETALVIATEPRVDQARKVFVSFTHVAEKDQKAFLEKYQVTRRDDAQRTPEEARGSLNVVCMRELWDRLKINEPLGNVAEIHKGLEWVSAVEGEEFIADSPKEGFRLGVCSAQGLLAFEQPETKYLCFDRDRRRRGDFDAPWDEPKVFINAARISRGPWRIAAFADTSGLITNKRFFALWPKSPWTVASIAGFLNSAIANAFVAAHDLGRDVRKQTLEQLPLPKWGVDEIRALEHLVTEYQQASRATAEQAKAALLAMDAFILQSYRLAPRLERELLDMFSGSQRPVPLTFTEFYAPDFESNIPLSMYISPEYKRCNAQYFLSHIPAITDPGLIEAFEEVSQ